MISKKNSLTEHLKKKLREFEFKEQPKNVGEVIEAGDGAIRCNGLSQVSAMEMVEIVSSKSKDFSQRGVVLNLEEDEVVAIVLGDYAKVSVGDTVKASGKLLFVPVGEELLGRVVNPLGEPLDGKGNLNLTKYYPVEKIAPGVIYRKSVDTPIQTGIKAIDSMIPIGRGQRELIIGDRKTGKTALAIDTIINQKNQDIVCIYVAIGQKTSSIALLIDTLRKHGAIDYSIIIAANAKDPAAMQYLAPYTGCAVGEYFMDQGKDALVIYDDLTKHAWAYREISLVLRRPSGREAYPGDVFYLHSRLLERACKLDSKYGGGSLTALPIIETQAEDVSAYIPTNVISITDGQIFLDNNLFYAGIRPAINVGLSVSRVGGAAQTKAMKQVSGKLRLELAQYRELSAFVQFASELDPETRKMIDRGGRMTQILKQKQFNPQPLEKQVVTIWAATNGFIDDVEIDKIQDFEREYLRFLMDLYSDLLEEIKRKRALTEDIELKLKKVTEEFKKSKVNN